MRKRILPLLLLAALAAAAAPPQTKPVLPERYRQWLDEEVVYIITPHERDVFQHLQTDRERDMFVEAFWKQRDPTPGTPRNEFREEHYRRVKYADDYYGRGTGKPGWMTDRGRTYIILGAPKAVDSFSNVQNVYPVEIWSYLGDPAVGLPTAFNVIFFKRNGVGDYIFYSPDQDGPQSLLADAFVSGEDPDKAYQTLKKYEPNLAVQVLSLVPGDRQFLGQPTLLSTKLMATIFGSPQKRVQDSYADAILKYKDFIEVEYTANYVPCDATSQVLRDASGAFAVHYSIEPGKISVEDTGGTYAVTFRVTGRVSDATGRTVTQFDRDFPFTLTREALDAARRASISLQDSFPLVPGSYNLDLLVKNTASKEFTSAEGKITVPGPAVRPEVGPLVLAYGAQAKPSGAAAEAVPFQAGREQLLVQSRKSFGAKETLVVFFQLYGLTPDLRANGSVRFAFFREDKPVSERQKKVGDFGAGDDVLERQDLSAFAPGYYQVRASLLDGQGRELSAGKADFEVLALPVYPRPMVIAKVRNSAGREDILYETGLQYVNRGDKAEGAARLTEAYRLAPGRPDIAAAYAQLLFDQGEFPKARDVLAPFAKDAQAPAEIVSLLGRTLHGLGDFKAALGYYTDYLARFGMNVDILNYAGTCYFKLGNRDEAVKAWAKSLELAPNQDQLRKLLDSLKK